MKKASKYTQDEFNKMLKNRVGSYSYLHPAISPSGQSFDEVDDDLGIVANAKQRYITQGWMKRHRASERAEMARDLHSLMSLEGALTPRILNAIYGYNMFDDHSGVVSKMRQQDKIVQAEAAEAEEDMKEEIASPPSSKMPELPEDVGDTITSMALDSSTIQPEHGTHKSQNVRNTHDIIAEEAQLLPATGENLLPPDERDKLKSQKVKEEHEELEQQIAGAPEYLESLNPPTSEPTTTEEPTPQPSTEPSPKKTSPKPRNGKKKVYLESKPDIPKKHHRWSLVRLKKKYGE